MDLAKNIQETLKTIPEGVRIVAATKYVDSQDMMKLFEVGIHNFGENRVDAFLQKYDELRNMPIHWHFIGHLQTNKAKQVLPKIEVLHSLDSLKLANIINQVCEKPLDCFIEVNVNEEESKNGISLENCKDFIKALAQYPKVNIVGLMMMTIKASTSEEKKEQFKKLSFKLQELNSELGLHLSQLSMGMSGDYIEAIEEGATTIRLGRILWEQLK